MQIGIPYWNKISESWKQVLAVVAVLQTIAFLGSIPLGFFNQYRFEKLLVEENRFLPEQSAFLEITSELYRNSQSSSYGYKEECERFADPLSIVDCDNLESLKVIVKKYSERFKLDEQEKGRLGNDLAILANLPTDNMF